MDNNIYPLFVLFQNEIFGNIYMNKIYVYKNRLYQIEFKKFQFDTAPFNYTNLKLALMLVLHLQLYHQYSQDQRIILQDLELYLLQQVVHHLIDDV